ncbi:hypothetical protein CesoFtcFv8_020774 [Champsocephalus esox]|uniref:Translocase of outer mitochondrial membrane 20 n=1 Tax=Champsocephalus esox TaxID=159716 RepID=A0AAN8BBV9_9TELE|nr:hypothetical protein CesoFtcFv8_020774 [Champsocephalus esox]
MASGRTGAVVAGVCGGLFVAYCIYFDRKRRSDPGFKEKLRERRRKQNVSSDKSGLARLPDLKDAEAVQKFFLEEIQLGEELLSQGDFEKGSSKCCSPNCPPSASVSSTLSLYQKMTLNECVLDGSLLVIISSVCNED